MKQNLKQDFFKIDPIQRRVEGRRYVNRNCMTLGRGNEMLVIRSTNYRGIII